MYKSVTAGHLPRQGCVPRRGARAGGLAVPQGLPVVLPQVLQEGRGRTGEEALQARRARPKACPEAAQALISPLRLHRQHCTAHHTLHKLALALNTAWKLETRAVTDLRIYGLTPLPPPPAHRPVHAHQ